MRCRRTGFSWRGASSGGAAGAQFAAETLGAVRGKVRLVQFSFADPLPRFGSARPPRPSAAISIGESIGAFAESLTSPSSATATWSCDLRSDGRCLFSVADGWLCADI